MDEPAKIVLDFRERELIAEMPEATVESLAVGDCHIIHEAAGICLIIERKTIEDLVASRKDGRYSEQKKRIQAATAASGMGRPSATYIIEGSRSAQLCCRPESAMCASASYITASMCIHTIYRDGIPVLFSKNPEETAGWIRAIALRIAKHPEHFASNRATPAAGAAAAPDQYLDALGAIKTQKIANLTPTRVYRLQIAQIPGFSLGIAEKIAEKYGNWAALADAVARRDPGLSSIAGLGKKRIETLREYVLVGFNDAPTETQ